MKIVFFSLFMAIACPFMAMAQSPEQDLNLNFEIIENGLPKGWDIMGDGDHKISIDSNIVKSGKYAILIENDKPQENYKVLSLGLPKNYNGKQIKLSGYIKTESHENSFAGLWMRIDPQIAFDNMATRGIKGSTDWTLYEISFELKPSQTDGIFIGALFAGQGKIWFDDFKVEVDGKDISKENIPAYENPLVAADKDHEFDNGSNITIINLDKNTLDNLTILGRIWGFLKYYHPHIGKGDYNWDYALFRFLPTYLKVKNAKERDALLVEWIESLGKVEKCKTCTKVNANAVLKPSLEWTKTLGLSKKLQNSIAYIYNNRHQEAHYYISTQGGAGNPIFKNEKLYAQFAYPDAGFRLLAVYKYWNMIEYFFPYKKLTDKPWDSILAEYIPILLQAKDENTYELSIAQMIAEIHDTHASIWDGMAKFKPIKGNNMPPFRLEFIENKLVVTDYYNPEYAIQAKVKIGDIITHINGEKVEDRIAKWEKYYPASNQPTRLKNMSFDMLRSTENKIDIQYISEEKTHTHTIDLYDIHTLNMYGFYKVDNTTSCYKILEGNIGYITLANIKDTDIPKIKEELANTKGIIVDIRNYPSTFVVFSLVPYFLDAPKQFTKITAVNPNHPGEFNYLPTFMLPASPNFYKGKLAVLVNGASVSQSEYTAMAFRAVKDAKIIGNTTAGADGNVSEFYLPGNLKTMISGLGVYYPDGGETQRIGIVPDIEVKPTIEGIKAGKDEILLKAIEYINQ